MELKEPTLVLGINPRANQINKRAVVAIVFAAMLALGILGLFRSRATSKNLYVGEPIATNIQFPSKLQDNKHVLFWTGSAIADLDTATGVTTSKTGEFSVPSAHRVRWAPDQTAAFVATDKPSTNDYEARATDEAPERFWWRVDLGANSVTPVFCSGTTPPFDVFWTSDGKTSYLCPKNAAGSPPASVSVVAIDETTDDIEVLGAAPSGPVIQKGNDIYQVTTTGLRRGIGDVNEAAFVGKLLYATTAGTSDGAASNLVRTTEPFTKASTVWRAAKLAQVIPGPDGSAMLMRAGSTKKGSTSSTLGQEINLEIVSPGRSNQKYIATEGAEKLGSTTFFSSAANLLLFSNDRHEAFTASTDKKDQTNQQDKIVSLVAFDPTTPMVIVGNRGSMAYRVDTNELNIYLAATPSSTSDWQTAITAATSTIRAHGVDPNLVNKHYFGKPLVSD